ncbi:UNVERIFIED_CONTAM: hypothetical protein GTU68_011830 [Idotea baltica]|nr:hypothetical protein [Idotea baltica]
MVERIVVIRNDQLDLNSVSYYDAVVLSPGPGLPKDAGLLMELIERYADEMPILGVCLGLQAIGEHFGAKLYNMPTVLHGQPSDCELIGEEPLFEGCSNPLTVGHYHSWVVDESGLPSCLKVTARHSDGYIMALRHISLPISAVQFHPESILTPEGKKILANWVKSLCKS